jgi:tetratricopeptide (TPR) repeat protein
MTEFLREELRKAVRDSPKKPLLICGAGVSTQATDGLAPTWASLIKSGITRVADLDANAEKWTKESRQRLTTGDTATWIAIADSLTERLGGVRNAEFATWLEGEVGQLAPARHDLLDAIFALQCPIATTNYDDILEKAIGLQPIGWDDHVGTHQFLDGKRQGILHLHGHWRSPARVVLGSKSYGEHSVDKRRELLQEVTSLNRPTIFIGCSQDGLTDPDFSRLDSFLTEWQDVAPRRYWLIRLERDDKGQPKPIPSPDHTRRLYPVVYGEKYDDLVPLLRSLAPPPTTPLPLAIDFESAVRCIDQHEPKPALYGRENEIDTIVGALLAGRSVIVGGGPGMGKTALAIATFYDSRLTGQFGRRRVFATLETVTEPRALLVRIVEALGLPTVGDEASLLRMLEANAAERPIAAILDNVETVFDANPKEAERVLALMTQVKGLASLITIRGIAPNIPNTITVGELSRLPQEAARDAFLALAGSRFRADVDLDHLLDSLDGHALSIRLVAAQAIGVPALRGLRDSWDEVHAELLRRPGEKETRLTSVRASLAISLKSRRIKSTPLARRLMAVLSYLPGGLAETDVRSVLGERGALTKAKANDAIVCLYQSALVERRPDFRLRLLTPLRECAKSDITLMEVDRKRLLERYLTLCDKAGKIGHRDWNHVCHEVEPEVDNLDPICKLTISTNIPHRGLNNALVGLGRFHEFSGRGGIESLREIVARFGLPPKSSMGAICLYYLGAFALGRSDHKVARAQIEEARLAFERIGDVLGEANCLHSLGQQMFALSAYEVAREHLEKAIPLYRSIRQTWGEANSIHLLGLIDRNRSELESARTRFKIASALYERGGEALGAANCILELGWIEGAGGNYNEASLKFEEALLLYRRVGSRVSEANSIVRLARIALMQRKCEAARAHFEAAISIYKYFGDILGEANCIYSLGQIHFLGDNYPAALRCFEESSVLFRQGGYEDSVARSAIKKGQTLLLTSDEHRGLADIEVGFGHLFRVTDLKDLALPGWHALHKALTCKDGGEATKYREMARSSWAALGRHDLVQEWID